MMCTSMSSLLINVFGTAKATLVCLRAVVPVEFALLLLTLGTLEVARSCSMFTRLAKPRAAVSVQP